MPARRRIAVLAAFFATSIALFQFVSAGPEAFAAPSTAAQAKVSPSSLSFPKAGTKVGLYLTTPAQTVTLTNTGTVPLQLFGCGPRGGPCTTGSYAADFSFATDDCAEHIVPTNTSCSVSISFTPSTPNEETATLEFADNTAAGSNTVELVGKATSATVTVSTSSLSFPASQGVRVGQTSAPQKVTVTNSGTTPVQMGYAAPNSTNPAISSTYPGDFVIPTNTCAQHSIPAGGTCTFSVEFKPSTTNTETGTVSIYDDAFGGPQTVALSGQGVAATADTGARRPSPTAAPAPA